MNEVNNCHLNLTDSRCYDTLRFNKKTWMLKAVLLGYDTTSQGNWFPVFWRQHSFDTLGDLLDTWRWRCSVLQSAGNWLPSDTGSYPRSTWS